MCKEIKEIKEKKLMIEILNLKLVILLEYQNIKAFLQEAMFQFWSEEVFVITKVKNTVPCRYVISDLKRGKIVGTFYDKELQKKQIKKSLELKK